MMEPVPLGRQRFSEKSWLSKPTVGPQQACRAPWRLPTREIVRSFTVITRGTSFAPSCMPMSVGLEA